MGRKKAIYALLGCVGLFLAALLLIIYTSKRRGDRLQPGRDAIAISEVVADNRTYPSPDGRYLDFVEICNLSDETVDLSGFVLTDHPDEAGYLFPDGTVLKGGEYLLCWCDKADSSGQYGRFGISSDVMDTLYLYNAANVCIDQREIPDLPENHAVMLKDDGEWIGSAYATPGFSNDEEGYEAYMNSIGAEPVPVCISEVMTDNGTTVQNPEGEFCDWVELYNQGTSAVVLEGCFLSDDPYEPLRWAMPTMTIEPGERKIICCSATGSQAPFGLSKDGCTVVLTDRFGQTISRVEVPRMEQDRSYALQSDGSRQVTVQATPGFENSAVGYE